GLYDVVAGQPGLFRQLRRAHRALDHGIHGHIARVARLGEHRVRIHHLGEELLIEAPPVHADADWFPLVDRDLDDGAEVVVAAFGPDVARVDAVFRQRPRALGILGQQQVAVVVKVADDRNVYGGDDGGDRARRLIRVHRHADELAAGRVQRAHLRRGRGDVGGVGVGHRLDDDWMGAAHLHAAHVDRDCRASDTHGEQYSAAQGGAALENLVLQHDSQLNLVEPQVARHVRPDVRAETGPNANPEGVRVE